MPASTIQNFDNAWQNVQNSEAAQRAREASKKQDQPRLSIQISALRQRQARAQGIADWIDQDWDNWYFLSSEEQELWHEHERGDIIAQIFELRRQQQPRYPGAAENLAALMSSD